MIDKRLYISNDRLRSRGIVILLLFHDLMQNLFNLIQVIKQSEVHWIVQDPLDLFISQDLFLAFLYFFIIFIDIFVVGIILILYVDTE